MAYVISSVPRWRMTPFSPRITSYNVCYTKLLRLVNRGDRWLIFNVKVEGVSYVSNYRAELDAEIRGSSLQAVIDRLESEASSVPDE